MGSSGFGRVKQQGDAWRPPYKGFGNWGRKDSKMQGGMAQYIRGLPQPIAETTALDYSWSR